MADKNNESKINVVLTALLVVFVCLLSFGVGVISGKGWSDRAYKVRHIEEDTHLKMALSGHLEDTPLGDEMTEKEVQLLTERALEEARAQAPNMADHRSLNPSPGQDLSAPATELASQEGESQAKSEITTADTQTVAKRAKRQVSSIGAKPTMPKPSRIEFTVQVAAYKTINEAESHSQKLIDKGFPAFPVRAIINGAEWYRVSIGSFKTREQAVKYEKALQKQSIVKSTFVQKIQRL